MEKLIKIAEITATNEKRLNEVLETLKNKGFQIVYNEEYEYSAYICVTE